MASVTFCIKVVVVVVCEVVDEVSDVVVDVELLADDVVEVVVELLDPGHVSSCPFTGLVDCDIEIHEAQPPFGMYPVWKVLSTN